MNQSTLLDFAKQGDPEAIAALMNLVLQPKGVTAETQMQNDCLHVFLSSTRILNQQTLVGFTRKGLANLGLKSIQAVKVYGKKVGEDLPIWTEEFAVPTDPELSPEEVAPTVIHTPEVIPPDARQIGHRSQVKPMPPEVYLNQLRRSPGQIIPWLQFRLNQLLFATERVTAQIPLPKNLFPASVRPSRFLAALTLITIPAFFLGVTVAMVSSLLIASSKHFGAALSTSTSDSQLALQSEVEKDILNQQTQALKYLRAMNKAQQGFYAKNKRFASNLEDLERSASVISQSYNYVYKLTLAGEDQAQLAASPKAKGLKSYTGIVFLSESAEGTETTASTICGSNLPSMIPPKIPAPVDAQISCPTGSSKAS